MNVAFYVSGNAGRVRKLLSSDATELLASTKLIFSDDRKNADMKDQAERLDIEYECMHFGDIEKTDLPKSRLMSDALLASMQQRDIDYCFCFGAHILSGDLLVAYEHRIINFHPSILPLFPGLNAIDQAFEAKANLLGNTAHFIDAGIDTGPIIMQNIVTAKASGNDYEAILDQQIPMTKQIFQWLNEGRLSVRDGQVTIQNADYQQSVFFPALEERT